MDTRQLAAFCAVVERQSFSQAAERLGCHPARGQPAGALAREAARQQLLDRSGRRVEPTEAGLALYRGAQRMLALEEQLLDERRRRGERRARAARSRSAPRPGRAASSSRCSSASSSARNPELHVALSVSDTQTVVERVAERELELGVVGAARRHRGVVFEPFFRDEVVLACPPGHRVRRARR